MSQLIRRAVLFCVVSIAAYRYYTWNYYTRMMLKSGISVYGITEYWWLRPYGVFFEFLSAWNNIYEMRVIMFKHMKTLTVGIPQPIWNPIPSVLTADPLVVRHILKDRFDNYIKPQFMVNSLKEILGDGIFAVNHGPYAEDQGAFWSLQRKTAAKVFTNNNFKSLMFDTFRKHSLHVADIVDNKLGKDGEAVVELQGLMYRFTLDSIGTIGFGTDLGSLANEDDPFIKAFNRSQHLCVLRFLHPLWNTFLGKFLYSSERELPEHVKVLDDYCMKIIEQRKKELLKGDSEKGDILTLFLQEKLNLSNDQLRDVVMSFLVAGRDTTACTLTFALLCLAQNPIWQEKLRAEVRNVVQGRDMRVVDATDIAKMKILQNTVMEALRMFPPVPLDPKEAATDDVLPGGFRIPKGTRISYEPYVMGRLGEIWGLDADQFRPDRWDKLEHLPSPYEFPVFQAGPRICLGESLAKFEASLLLALLVDRFEFSPIPDRVYQKAMGITLSVSNGMELNVKRLGKI